MANVPLTIKVSADGTTQTTGELAKVTKAVKAQGEALSSSAVMWGNLKASAIAFGASKIRSVFSDIRSEMDRIGKISTTFGISPEQVQRLSQAAKLGGSSIEEVTTAIAYMQRVIEKGTANKTLEKIGINIDSIKNLSADEQFLAISDALNKMDEGAEKTAASMDLFSRSGAKLIPVMKDLRANMAGAWGIVSEEEIRRIEKANDTVSAFYDGIKGTITKGSAIAIDTAKSYATIINPFKTWGETLGELQDIWGDTEEEITRNTIEESEKRIAQAKKEADDRITAIKKANDEIVKSSEKITKRLYEESLGEKEKLAYDIEKQIKEIGFEGVKVGDIGQKIEALKGNQHFTYSEVMGDSYNRVQAQIKAMEALHNSYINSLKKIDEAAELKAAKEQADIAKEKADIDKDKARSMYTEQLDQLSAYTESRLMDIQRQRESIGQGAVGITSTGLEAIRAQEAITTDIEAGRLAAEERALRAKDEAERKAIMEQQQRTLESIDQGIKALERGAPSIYSSQASLYGS